MPSESEVKEYIRITKEVAEQWISDHTEAYGFFPEIDKKLRNDIEIGIKEVNYERNGS
jgi:hypothetical protein